MFSFLNKELLSKVFETRRRIGLSFPRTIPENNLNKLFQGMAVVDSSTGKKYIIQEFLRHWYDGWCIVASMEEICDDGFKRLVNVIWQNEMSVSVNEHDEMRTYLKPIIG